MVRILECNSEHFLHDLNDFVVKLNKCNYHILLPISLFTCPLILELPSNIGTMSINYRGPWACMQCMHALQAHYFMLTRCLEGTVRAACTRSRSSTSPGARPTTTSGIDTRDPHTFCSGILVAFLVLESRSKFIRNIIIFFSTLVRTRNWTNPDLHDFFLSFSPLVS